MRRLNFHTDSGAKTTVIASAHSRDCPIAEADAVPLNRSRTASARIVTGFTLTHACSQPGMVSVGTNALLVNVSGNVTTKPKICTFSGLSTITPTSTATHDTARVKMSTSTYTPSTPDTPPCTRYPSSEPTPSSSEMAQTCLTVSATIRPDSGAQRAIGSDRSRSYTPLVRSVESPTPVVRVAKIAFCTMMPGSANCR